MNKLLMVCVGILALGAIGYGLYSYNAAQQTLQKPEPTPTTEVMESTQPEYSPIPRYSAPPKTRLTEIYNNKTMTSCTKNSDCTPYQEIVGTNDSDETEIIRFCGNSATKQQFSDATEAVQKDIDPVSCACVSNVCESAD